MVSFFMCDVMCGVRRFPGLRLALDYVQAALQAQVALATGQDYGSFATLNGVPLGLQFITAQDVTAGARRGYGQSCLAEPNALYDVRTSYLCCPCSFRYFRLQGCFKLSPICGKNCGKQGTPSCCTPKFNCCLASWRQAIPRSRRPSAIHVEQHSNCT